MLNYNYRNNKGQDALQVLKSTVVVVADGDDSDHSKSDEIKNKEEYLSKLLELIKLPSKEEDCKYDSIWQKTRPKPESNNERSSKFEIKASKSSNNEKLYKFSNSSKSFNSVYHLKSKDIKEITNDESKSLNTSKSFNSTYRSKSKDLKEITNDESTILDEFEIKERKIIDDELDSKFQLTDMNSIYTEQLIQNDTKLLNDEKKSSISSKEINHTSLESPESNPSNKENKNTVSKNDVNLSTTELLKQNHLITSDSQMHNIKENSNEKSANESKASEKTSQKVKFEMYRESFSEKPDSCFQQKSQVYLDKR